MSASATFSNFQTDLRTKPWLKWVIALTASLGAILEVIDVSIVNVALPDIQAQLGATLSEIGWVVTGYAIANVIIIPLTAWLSDYFGKKRYFIWSMIAFTLASILCGFATSLPMLIFARVLQGLGGGGLLAKAQTILFETFPKEEQGMAQALFGVGVIAGPVIGPTLGGYITTNLDWRWIFFINLPIGILAVIMAILTLPEDSKIRAVSRKVDWLGIGLLIVAVGSLQWMLEEGQTEGWFESGFIVTLAATAAIGLALFIWRELAVESPAVDLRVLKNRSLAAGSIFSAVLGMGLYGALFAIPIFAQSILGYTPLQTGTLLMPGAIASALMMPVMGKLVSRFDARALITCGALVLVGTLIVFSDINPQSSRESMFWPLIFRGVGTVMMFLPLSLATLSGLPKKDISAGSGFYNLTRQLGGSVGIAILTTLLYQRTDFHKSVLTEKITVYAPATVERISQITSGLIAKGIDPITAQQQAYGIISKGVNLQATVMSFGDIFRVVAFVFLASLPLVFFLGRGRGQAPPDAH